jgi:hypothetical protein
VAGSKLAADKGRADNRTEIRWKTEADTDEHASLGWGGGQNGGGETERRNNRRSTETGSAANLCFNHQRSPSIREPKLT